MELEFDPLWINDSAECLRMFFVFDSVLDTSVMDSTDIVELFEMIQRESLQ